MSPSSTVCFVADTMQESILHLRVYRMIDVGIKRHIFIFILGLHSVNVIVEVGT